MRKHKNVKATMRINTADFILGLGFQKMKGKIVMASIKKIRTVNEVYMLLRHNARGACEPYNRDINSDFSDLNVDLLDGKSDFNIAYERFCARKNELYVRKQADVVNAIGVIVTAPEDLSPDRYSDFFNEAFNFLNSKFGSENCVQAVVHNDESGMPHLHYVALPVVEDHKHEQGFKLACSEVLTRSFMRKFHPDYQSWMNEHGLSDAHVHTGITARNGGNKEVWKLKQERELALAQKYEQKQEFHF